MPVYEGAVEAARVSRLEPSTHYRVHVAAKNEAGRSDFTPPLHVNTTAAIMQQPPPLPPQLPPPPPLPQSLPTTSANTSINYYHPYPTQQPPMAAAHSIAHPFVSTPPIKVGPQSGGNLCSSHKRARLNACSCPRQLSSRYRRAAFASRGTTRRRNSRVSP